MKRWLAVLVLAAVGLVPSRLYAGTPLATGDFCLPVQPVFTKGDNQIRCETLPDRNGNKPTFSADDGFILQTPFMGTGWFASGRVCADGDPSCTKKFHIAEDWSIPGSSDMGAPIYATANGYVRFVEVSGGVGASWGKVIIIEHQLPSGKRYWSVYAHMKDVLVDTSCQPTTTPWSSDCVVKKGQWIATIGDAEGYWTSHNSGPHLHFEIRDEEPDWTRPTTGPMNNPWMENPNDPDVQPIVRQYVHPIEFIRAHGKKIPACVLPPYMCTTPELWCERGGGFVGPSVITEAPFDVTATTATLQGTVNPSGAATEAYFLWDDDRNLDFETTHTAFGSENDDRRFTATIPIICGGKTYYAKAVAENALGQNSGSIFSFTSGPCTGTNPPPPFSLTGSTVESSPTVGGPVVKVAFERFATGNGTQLYYDLYRNDTLVYTMQAAQYTGAGELSDTKGGLYGNTTYTYRIVARDGIGTTSSTNTLNVYLTPSDGPAMGTPVVATNLPEEITPNGGYFAAAVTGNGQPTDVVFEWGADTTYGNTTDAVSLPEPTHISQKVKKGIFGLSCNPGVYHYRAVVCRNGVVASFGGDQTLALDCAGTAPVTEAKPSPEIATVALWHMDGTVRTERKTRSEEGTESKRLTITGYPLSVPGFNGEADGAYQLTRSQGDSFLTNIGPPEDKDITWMGWVKSNNPSSDHTLLYLYEPTSSGEKQALVMISEEHVLVSFQKPPDTGVLIRSTGVIPAGVWKHVAFTRESGVYKIYINGNLDTTYSTGSNLDVTTLSTTSSTACACDLDEIHLLYGKAWSVQEISAYYSSASPHVVQPLPPAPPSLSSPGSLNVVRSQGQYVYIYDAAQQNLDLSGDFTLEVWVKLRTSITSLANYTLISKWGTVASDRAYNFEYYHNGTTPVLRLTTDAGGGQDAGVETAYTLPLAQWRHVGVTYTKATGTAEFFADCTSLGTVSGLTTTLNNGNGSLFIGSRAGYPGRTFDGLIDEVRIWSVRRTAAQIASGCTTTFSSGTPGLASNWHFDHTFTDGAGSGNTLTTYNGANFSDEEHTTWTPPPPSNKRSLDLERSQPELLYINDSSQQGLDLIGNFTVEAWVKPESITAAHTILSKWGSGQGSYWIGYELDGTTRKLFVNLTSNGTTEVDKKLIYDIGTGTWRHLAVSCRIVSAGACDIYVNTQLVGTLTGFPTSIFSGSGRFEIGTAEGGRMLDGQVDEIRVWNKARTQAEIANDYAVTLTGTESGLVAYYSFDGTNGSTTDKTANHNNLTASDIMSYVTDVPF